MRAYKLGAAAAAGDSAPASPRQLVPLRTVPVGGHPVLICCRLVCMGAESLIVSRRLPATTNTYFVSFHHSRCLGLGVCLGGWPCHVASAEQVTTLRGCRRRVAKNRMKRSPTDRAERTTSAASITRNGKLHSICLRQSLAVVCLRSTRRCYHAALNTSRGWPKAPLGSVGCFGKRTPARENMYPSSALDISQVYTGTRDV